MWETMSPLPTSRRMLIVALSFWAAAVAPAVSAAPPEPPEVSKCQSCHGRDGNSISSEVPRLNGQQPLYLARRMRSFADPTRQSFHAIHYMWDVNAQLSDGSVAALAEYFSAQAPTAFAPTGALKEQGRRLYESGDGAQLPACQSCHGGQGEGRGDVPRLAGQHAQYLRMQMQSFSLRARVNETMNPHTRSLSDDQIAALVAYLARD
jgi:cytochrome c553